VSLAKVALLSEVERALGKLDFNGIDDFDVIVEWGAGAAALANIVLNSLAWRGLYILVDLPVLSALQCHTLGMGGTHVFEELPSTPTTGVFCVSGVDTLEAAITSLDKSDDGRRLRRLFVSSFALSETPLAERARLLPVISNFDALAIIYNTPIADFDAAGLSSSATMSNRDFFGSTFRLAIEAADCHSAPGFGTVGDAEAIRAAQCKSGAYGSRRVEWYETRYMPCARLPASWMLVGGRAFYSPSDHMRAFIAHARCSTQEARRDISRFVESAAVSAILNARFDPGSVLEGALEMTRRVCSKQPAFDCAVLFFEIDVGDKPNIRVTAEPAEAKCATL